MKIDKIVEMITEDAWAECQEYAGLAVERATEELQERLGALRAELEATDQRLLGATLENDWLNEKVRELEAEIHKREWARRQTPISTRNMNAVKSATPTAAMIDDGTTPPLAVQVAVIRVAVPASYRKDQYEDAKLAIWSLPRDWLAPFLERVLHGILQTKLHDGWDPNDITVEVIYQ